MRNTTHIKDYKANLTSMYGTQLKEDAMPAQKQISVHVSVAPRQMQLIIQIQYRLILIVRTGVVGIVKCFCAPLLIILNTE